FCLLSFAFPASTPTQIYTLSLHDALPISSILRLTTRCAVLRASAASPAAPEYLRSPPPSDEASPPASTEFLAEFRPFVTSASTRSEEHTSELQSRGHLVCRLLLEKKKHIL